MVCGAKYRSSRHGFATQVLWVRSPSSPSSADHADLEIEPTVKFDADLSYGDPKTAVWDSEDSTQFFINTVEETVQREEAVRVEISASFQGLDADSFTIGKMSFAESRNPILIRPSVDEGWPYK